MTEATIYSTGVKVESKILTEPFNLMHPRMQDRHNTNIAIGKLAPIDHMLLISETIALDAKFSRNGAGEHTGDIDPVKGGKQTGDITLSLGRAPTLPGITVNIIQPQGGGFLDTHLTHELRFNRRCAR